MSTEIKVLVENYEAEHVKALKIILCAWAAFILICIMCIIEDALFGSMLFFGGLMTLTLSSITLSKTSSLTTLKDLVVNLSASLKLLRKPG